MDNNIINLLSSMIGKNNFQNNQGSPQENPASAYYPSDAYPQSQNSWQNSSSNFNPNNGGILPLLLSLMCGNNNQLAALSKIFSGGDTSALESLMKTNKKSPQENAEQSVPHDDVLL